MSVLETSEIRQAAARVWDIAIVGAGPAGALAALVLAGRKIPTLLVERATFPRYKVCGCCINGRARAVLERAGAGDLLAQSGAVPLTAVRLGAEKRSALLHLAGGVSLSRERFDTALVERAVGAGAHFLPGTRASLEQDAADSGEFRRLELHQGTAAVEVRARVVLAADGLGGALLARAGLTEAPPQPGARMGAGVVLSWDDPFYQPGTIYMACGREGYVGLVRLEDGRLDVAAALDAPAVRAVHGPARVAERVLEEVGWPMPPLGSGQHWTGTPPLTRQARQLAGHRVFVLGDAAGYVEPFTGEGMAWALAAAEAVAPLAARAAQRWTPDLPRTWTRSYHRLVTKRQGICRATASLLRRPALTRLLVQVLDRVPVLATPFVYLLNHSTEAPR